jgi:peptidyl-prolyl cis-trans isomerase A (cyclophilin A)
MIEHPNISRRQAMFGAAAVMAAPGTPTVILVTALGEIRIRVNTTAAPISANDFLSYVREGSYNGGRFFRTVRPGNDHGTPQIDVVQGGTRPGAKLRPPVVHEATAITGLRHLDGTVSLPRDKPGTGSGAEIFVCIGAQPALDFGGKRNPDGQGFAAFGQVTKGMDIVRRVWSMDASGAGDDPYVNGQILRAPVKFISARIT